MFSSQGPVGDIRHRKTSSLEAPLVDPIGPKVTPVSGTGGAVSVVSSGTFWGVAAGLFILMAAGFVVLSVLQSNNNKSQAKELAELKANSTAQQMQIAEILMEAGQSE
jgi:hypothetical protein